MTSEKCFLKWLREAGRGHITAFLAWGCMAGYVLVKGVQLTLSTEYNFFGIGSTELLWVCAGLGLALSLLEFSYLLQPGKLDFYYSLPVKKSTIFWSRYAHGFLHFMISFCLGAAICGIFESSLDPDFFPYSGSYTGHSILAFAAVFLLFYHVGILWITICGNMIPVILGYVVCLFYGHILVGNAFTMWAEIYFHTYYKIPLLEKMDVILAPISLAGEMTGNGLFDKRLVFEYIPSGTYIAGASGWILLSFLLFTVAQKRRKAERIGKIFIFPLAERATEILLSFLVGIWISSFCTNLSGLAPGHPTAGVTVGILAGIFASAIAHFLLEWGVGCGKKNVGSQNVSHWTNSEHHEKIHIRGDALGIFRRKWQLVGECAAVILAGAVFFVGASLFDTFLPEEGEVEKIGISVDGFGMNHESYMQILINGDRYETAKQLEKYVLSKDGKIALREWIEPLVQKKNFSVSKNICAAVCWHMKNGKEIYRLYPVDEEDVQSFASVYETEEYKSIAYPSAWDEKLVDARFSWSDGIMDTALKLTDEEKEAIVDAYRQDVGNMKMENLGEALPLGFLDIDSEMLWLSGEIVVYPFFTRTCDLLEKQGVSVHKRLSDYQVRSVSVSSVSEKGFGKYNSKYYDDPTEIEQWKQKAVPDRFDLQPFLYPLDYSQEIRAEVIDETTNSAVYVTLLLIPSKTKLTACNPGYSVLD